MQKEDDSSNGSNLAYNLKGIANLNLLGKKIERLVISGDNRVNVQPGLLTHHTLWAREHNRLVDELLSTHPTMTGKRKKNVFSSLRNFVVSSILVVIIVKIISIGSILF